ncbi:(2Fe-2S)-binding protein [Ulvibacterium sp.]|uniref:(2Fe-2S)-binding protein n=1 Tax=Ulvibacterium sp. TaxID=2665914 RepID=UPI0026314C9A|nr:(2Fe-2S)-binding protein [Ulvibacterium sp.]
MPSYTLTVNAEKRTVSVDSDTPLLWVLRDHLGLTGTKYGCGRGICGNCTVHYQGNAIRSCVLPITSVLEGNIVTIEGLSENENHPVQQAWMELDVPQCGYCQSGQIMATVDLLSKIKNPTDADINTAMQGVLCRCGTYSRIRKAIHRAASIQDK